MRGRMSYYVAMDKVARMTGLLVVFPTLFPLILSCSLSLARSLPHSVFLSFPLSLCTVEYHCLCCYTLLMWDSTHANMGFKGKLHVIFSSSASRHLDMKGECLQMNLEFWQISDPLADFPSQLCWVCWSLI